MKEYPLTKGELYGLATLGGLATACFTAGSALFSSSFSISKDIAFSSNVPEKVIVYYETISRFSFWGSLGLFLIGAILVFAGGVRVRQIISETTHE
jgi:hypothetical protein